MSSHIWVLLCSAFAQYLFSQVNRISGYSYKVSFRFTSAISCGGTVVLQNRQMKEALFMKEVQANQLRW